VAVKRIRVLLVVLAAFASISWTTPSANARDLEVRACGTRVDIGVTVYSESQGRVKGSGSYTSQSCLAIYKVYLVIVRGSTTTNMTEVGYTKVTKYPSEPSSLKFSPKDYDCFNTGLYYYYRTKISWQYQGGGGGVKYSNRIRVDCI
jgi:hypothetical protein